MTLMTSARLRGAVSSGTLGPNDVRAWTERHDVRADLHTDLPRVHTVAEAAEVMQTTPDRIAKSVVFDTPDGALVVLARGDAKVRERLVVDHVGGVRNDFRMAKPAQVLEWTGYPVGGVPPFAHRQPLRTLMDKALLSLETVVFGGGTDRALLSVAPAEVRRVTDAELGIFTG